MVAHSDGRDYPHDADNKARIYEDDRGNLWVSHEDLLRCGYILLNDFDVVYLNGTFYELQGYIRKAKAWWIEQVEQTFDPDSTTPEAIAGESK